MLAEALGDRSKFKDRGIRGQFVRWKRYGDVQSEGGTAVSCENVELAAITKQILSPAVLLAQACHHMSSPMEIEDLKVEQLQLSETPNFECSLHFSWQAGAGPEIVITGKRPGEFILS